jgi:hypothetical protein
MNSQPSRQREAAVMPGQLMAEFPVFSGGYERNLAQDPRWQTNRGAGIPLNIYEPNYQSYCEPTVTTNRDGCIAEYFYDSHSGQFQGNTPQEPPIGARVSWQNQRRPFPFYEWAMMGQYQVQNPDTQYSDTKSPFGIDKVYGGSFNDWIMGPWIMAITQEVYHQYNPAISTPWQQMMGM